MRSRIDLSYDGTEFHGWATQPGLRTVQGTLEAALATVLRVPEVSVTCAGRTDTGVHARGQVVHVEIEEYDDRLIRRLNARQLPEGYPVDEHFNPPYNPWEQRLCMVPDGDLFRAIRQGRASVVTDRIETFTERGIRLASGREIEADIIVTATGLNLLPFGGIELTVDGQPVRLPERVAYKGVMLDGVTQDKETR